MVLPLLKASAASESKRECISKHARQHLRGIGTKGRNRVPKPPTRIRAFIFKKELSKWGAKRDGSSKW